ncbi:hypothetical protein [Amycolatopsis sp. NPDC049159]|uniref:hypothetical protein n=1 Tax=unclassified Amycolatopsis TaxID=2618356 RepID=UPI00340C3242
MRKAFERGGGVGIGALMTALGVAAVLIGWNCDGYLQSVLLEVGAAFLLLAPLKFVEIAMTRRIGRRVEDGVAEALNGTSGSPHPDDADRIRTHLIRQLDAQRPREWKVVNPPDEPFDFVLERKQKRIAVVIRHTPFPLDSATVRRMMAEARVHGIPELIVISLSIPTELAAEQAERTPGLHLIASTDDGVLEAEFGAAVGLDLV